jgi:glycosyltransferase involved in cell wall biosynthesis
MRILTVIDAGYPVHGGAQITHLTFLRKLAARGYRCTYLDRSQIRRGVRRGAVDLDFFRDDEELIVKVGRRRPDVLIGALDAIHRVVRLGERLGVPSIAYLNSYEYAPPTAAEIRRWKLSFGKPYPSPAEREFALQNADLVLANSEHLRAWLAARQGAESTVLYPEFRLADFMLPDDRREGGEYVSGICGYSHKGAEIFLELARRFPNERFLLVGAVDYRHYRSLRAQPNVTLLPFSRPKEFLRRSRVVLVPSQWAEPFGRIAVEAMANAIPTLASRAGGLKEIVAGSELGVTAFRQAEAWEAKLAHLLSSPVARRRNAEQGRALTQRFLRGESAERLGRLVRELGAAAEPRPPERTVVAIRGRADESSAYARINRQWSSRLNERGRYETHGLPGAGDFCPRPVDVFVHHSYEENFETATVPDEGKLIAVRTWDFGPFPAKWAAKVNRDCDQLWVYSRWVRQQAIAGGVDPRKVRVVPLGVDEAHFRPDGPVFPLPTDRRFRFLFVGATVLRKGVDILLRAYGEAFGPQDDVCLVVKDRTGDVFYRGASLADQIMQRARDPRFPEIFYLCEDLPAEEVASLYRACDVGVFPYRAEGFGLPILEGMACGVPPIVPRFGASLDFCAATSSFQIPAKRIKLPVRGRLAINTLGITAELEDVDFCEVPVDRLAEAMRRAYRMPRERLRRVAARAVTRAHGRFRWADSLDRVERELAAVARRALPERLKRSREERERDARLLVAARDMFLGLEAARALPVREQGSRRPP